MIFLKKILEELEQRGHKIEITPKWSNGKTMSVSINPKNNILHGACTAKGSIGYSIGCKLHLMSEKCASILIIIKFFNRK